jgi:phosphatidylserine decarboxylase
VYLPQGTEPRVLLGQKTVAGETVIATVGEAPVIAGAIQ